MCVILESGRETGVILRAFPIVQPYMCLTFAGLGFLYRAPMLISITSPTYSELAFLFLSISILAPFFILLESHFQSPKFYGEPVPSLPGSARSDTCLPPVLVASRAPARHSSTNKLALSVQPLSHLLHIVCKRESPRPPFQPFPL